MFNSKHTAKTAYRSGANQFKIGPAVTRFVLMLILTSFTVLFFVQKTQGSSNVAEIRSLEKQRLELQKEYSSLEVNASRLKSLQRIEEGSTAQGLVPVETNLETITVNQ